MSWMDAVDAAISGLVQRRRRQRKRREGRWDWWDDSWRVQGALRDGIRYTDDELLAMIQGPEVPLLSFNEAKRAMELWRSGEQGSG